MLPELRWVLRRLERRPAFALLFASIFATSFGISLVVATLARSAIGAALPYDEPDALYGLSEARPQEGIERMVSSFGSLEDWATRADGFASVGAVRTQVGTSFEHDDGVSRAEGAIVSSTMFETLRVEPALGRVFTADEDRRGAGVTVVVVSHDFWSDRLGADPRVIGTPIRLNGLPWTVVGVLPASVTLAPHDREPVDVWYPLGTSDLFYGEPVYTNRSYRIFQLIGRLQDGASPARATEDAQRLSAALAEENPDTHTGWQWSAESLRAQVLRGVEGPVASLFVGGVVLFLVAVVNLLSLFVHTLRRDVGELATRRALGADSTDILRLGIVELAVLGSVGGLAGTALAIAGIRALPSWLALPLPAHAAVGFDPVLALVGFGAAQAAVLGVGALLMSAVVARLRPDQVMSGRVVGSSSRGRRLSTAALGAQVMLTTVLAVGSAVAARSFLALSSADPGVDPSGLMTLRVDVPAEARDDAALRTTVDEVLAGLDAMPGVSAAFLWSPHMPTAANWFTRVRLADRPDLADADLPAVRINSVSPGAVQAVGLTVVAGRDMTVADRTAGRRVVLVSRTAAETWWGSVDDAVGRQLRRWNHAELSDVIGVVDDAPLSGRRGEGSDFFHDVYFMFDHDVQRNLVFLARTERDAMPDASTLRATIGSVAPDLPPYDVRPMSDRLAEQDALGRSAALLGMVFAVTAVVLASLGLYGGVSVVFARRRRELGLRQALGATPARVVREVAGGSLGLVVAGLVTGLGVAWFALTPLDPTLFVVGPHDPTSYALGVAVMLLAAVAALVYPSTRAWRLSPSDSLREGNR